MAVFTTSGNTTNFITETQLWLQTALDDLFPPYNCF